MEKGRSRNVQIRSLSSLAITFDLTYFSYSIRISQSNVHLRGHGKLHAHRTFVLESSYCEMMSSTYVVLTADDMTSDVT